VSADDKGGCTGETGVPPQAVAVQARASEGAKVVCPKCQTAVDAASFVTDYKLCRLCNEERIEKVRDQMVEPSRGALRYAAVCLLGEHFEIARCEKLDEGAPQRAQLREVITWLRQHCGCESSERLFRTDDRLVKLRMLAEIAKDVQRAEARRAAAGEELSRTLAKLCDKADGFEW